MATTVQLFIDNEFVDSETTEFAEVHDPATNELIARTPLATNAELERAVASSEKAFAEWSETATARRVRFLFKFHELIQQHTDDIAKIITKEHGKTFADAQGDVFRGLEVVEQACAMMSNMKGGFSDNVATNVDAFSLRQPLGVCAGICPFNFPAMIPLWMMPMAIAAGNTFILKPSERVPGASMYLAKLMKEAGLPKGVLNVVHGSINAANFICDDKRISAVSFVGSTPAGEAIYRRVKACGGGKRVQCNMGAKNHAVIMPDAAREQTLNALLGAAFGAAGQRCMAISVAVFVGDAKDWLDELAERSSKLKVTEGMQQGADLGPLISPQAKARVEGIVTRAVGEGARIALDGRNLQNAEYPKGNFFGPTILADVTTTMECYTTEIFGPVLCVMTAPTLDAAIDLCNANPYGNGTAIFTTSGASARKFQHRIEAGLIGVNLPIPVPPPYFTWSSAKHSFAGETHFFGHSAVDFYTRTKTVLTSWRDDDGKSRGAGSLVFKAQTK